MRLHNLGYLLKEGTRNVLHNKLMSFACIGVLLACLLLIGGASMISLNVNSMVSYVEDQSEVVLILDDGITQAETDALELRLSRMDEILSARYVSKEEALQSQRAALGEDAVLLDGFDENNVFPASYVVRVQDISQLDAIVKSLETLGGVEKVKAQTDVAEILTALKRTVGIAGAAVVAILIVVSVLIITNTIKISIFSRRKEINIMKYVGATDAFIRLPFLMEGMIIGLTAAILAFLILGAGYTYLIQWMNQRLGDYLGIFFNNAIAFGDVALYVFGAFTGLGIAVGVVGSGLFIGRYLRV